MALNLVQYDSDEDAPQIAPPKPTTQPEAKPAQLKKKDNESSDAGTKKVIKYSSLQTSKNILNEKKEGDKNEEWKPQNFDFKAQQDPNQIFEKANLKSKKNGYAVNFLSNLSKPKRELKNVSKPVVIEDSYVYENDPEEPYTKKLKTQTFAQEEDELDEGQQVRDVPNYSSLQTKNAANLRAFTDQDKEIIYNYAGKQGPINAGQIMEINMDDRVDPNWQSNAEKAKQTRMFDAQSKFGMPDKTAKAKNQLSALAFDAVANQDQYLAQNSNQRDAKKKTSEKYGW